MVAKKSKPLPLLLINRIFRTVESGSLEACVPKTSGVVRTRSESSLSPWNLWHFTKDTCNEVSLTPVAFSPIHSWLYLGCHSSIPCRGTRLSVANFIYAFAHSTEQYEHITSHECWSQKMLESLASVYCSWSDDGHVCTTIFLISEKRVVSNKKYSVLWQSVSPIEGKRETQSHRNAGKLQGGSWSALWIHVCHLLSLSSWFLEGTTIFMPQAGP